MKMKQILLVFLMLATYAAQAQWPNNPNKIVLGRQTTGDGLVFRGSGFPSYTPTTNKNAYVYADTTNSRVYVHIGTWLQVYPDAGDNDRDSTNEIQSIDSLYLSGNILRLKLEGSAGMGLDLSALNTAETDPVWLAEKGQYVTIASTANWDKDVTNDLTIDSNFDGDVSGVYNNLQLKTGVVGVNELSSTTVTPGAYTNANITVDSDGRVTAAGNGTNGTVTSVAATAGAGISVTGSPITSSGTLTITNTGDTDASNDLTTSTAWGGDLTGTGANPQVDGFRGREIIGQAGTGNHNNTYVYNQDSSRYYLLPLNTIFYMSVNPTADSITPLFTVTPQTGNGINHNITININSEGGGRELHCTFELDVLFSSYAYQYGVWLEYAPSYEFEKRALADNYPRLFVRRTFGGVTEIGIVKATAPTCKIYVKSRFPDNVRINPIAQTPRHMITTNTPLNGLKFIRADNLSIKNVITGSSVSFYKRMSTSVTAGFIQPIVSVNYGTDQNNNSDAALLFNVDLIEQGFINTKTRKYNLVGYFDWGVGLSNNIPNNTWVLVRPNIDFNQRYNNFGQSNIKLWVKRVTNNQLIFGVESPNTWYHLYVNTSQRVVFTDLSTNLVEAIPGGTPSEWNWTSFSAKSYKMPSVTTIDYPESGEISNISDLLKRYNGSQWRRIVDAPDATPTTGHVVYWDGTNWNTKADATGGAGTVTSVAATAGAGISVTGSPITSSGTLTITNTGDTDASNDLTTSTLWGGDLGGSGASPQVTKIRGVTVNGGFPSAGQVLGYNGSQWIGTTINTLPALSNNTLVLTNGSGQVVTDPAFITWGVDDYFLNVNGSITGTSFRDESLNTTSASTLGSWTSTGVLTSTTVGNGLTLTQNPNTLAVNRLASLSFLNFPSTSANSVSSVTLTISGAALGDVVSIGAPNSIPAGVVYFGYVSATNTVTIRMHNGSGGTVDPADDTFRVYVWK